MIVILHGPASSTRTDELHLYASRYGRDILSPAPLSVFDLFELMSSLAVGRRWFVEYDPSNLNTVAQSVDILRLERAS